MPWTLPGAAARTVIAVLLSHVLAGCGTREPSSVWREFSFPGSSGWHHEVAQQTAYDSNRDGKTDRLRYWRGSGIARELHDLDGDGWFDTLIVLVYEKERSRSAVRIKAPAVPVDGDSRASGIPELYREKA